MAVLRYHYLRKSYNLVSKRIVIICWYPNTYQPPTLTNIVRSCLIDLRFPLSWKRLEGVNESIVTIWYEPGSMYAKAKFTLRIGKCDCIFNDEDISLCKRI